MGFATGSEIAEKIWSNTRDHVPKDQRVKVFGQIADAMWNADCDTLEELISDAWPEVEVALRQIGYLDDED